MKNSAKDTLRELAASGDTAEMDRLILAACKTGGHRESVFYILTDMEITKHYTPGEDVLFKALATSAFFNDSETVNVIFCSEAFKNCENRDVILQKTFFSVCQNGNTDTLEIIFSHDHNKVIDPKDINLMAFHILTVKNESSAIEFISRKFPLDIEEMKTLAETAKKYKADAVASFLSRQMAGYKKTR